MNLRHNLVLCFLSLIVGTSTSNGAQDCNNLTSDIIFFINRSSNSFQGLHDPIRDFVTKFILLNKEHIQQNETRIASVVFSTDFEICFNLSSSLSCDSDMDATCIKKMLHSCFDLLAGKETCKSTGTSFQQLSTKLLADARFDVPKYIIFTAEIYIEAEAELNNWIMFLQSQNVQTIVIASAVVTSSAEHVLVPFQFPVFKLLEDNGSIANVERELTEFVCTDAHRRNKRSDCDKHIPLEAEGGRNCVGYIWWATGSHPEDYRFEGAVNGSCLKEGPTNVRQIHIPTGRLACTMYFVVTVHRCPSLPTYFPFGTRYCNGDEDNVYGSRCTFYCNSGYVRRGSSLVTCDVSGNSYQWDNAFPSCHVNTPPNLNTCRVSVTDSQGQETRSGYTSSLTNCMNQRDEWMHTQPTLLSFEIKADLNYAPVLPHYVSDLKFGVIGAKVKVVKVSVTGSETLYQEISMNDQPLCEKQSSSTRPLIGLEMLDCHSNSVTLSTSLVDGERLCIDMEAISGGFYDLLNDAGNFQEKVYFDTVSRKKRVCFKYDDTKPNHCSDTTCSSALLEPLKLSTRLTRTSAIVVSVEGWSDPIPLGGPSASASNIQKYRLDIHLVNVGSMDLRVDEGSIKDYGREFNATSWNKYTIPMVLPDENPRLYAIMLEVHDNAGNVRYARRLVMFDNSSTVELNESSILRVTTSDVRSNFTWQTDVTTNICVDWRGRFYNTEMLSNNFLKPVAVDTAREIYGHYDQIDGLLPINGTSNVHGVVRFELSWSGNEGNKFMLGEVMPVQTQTACFFMNLTDGDTCRVVVQAFDIMNNTKEDSVYVNIDHSGPVVTIQEVHGFLGQHGLLIKDTTALSQAVLSVQAMDPHSGIRTLQWVLGVNGRQGNISNGNIDVYRLKKKQMNCTGMEHCYCPVVGPCELSEHQMKFAYHQEEFNMDNHGDIQTNQYYLNITSTNNAGLSSTKQLDIILNMTSSSTIIILDGLTLVLKDDENSDEESNAGIIVGAVLGTIIAIIGCILLIVFTRKRLTRRRLQKETSSQANLEENKDKKPKGIPADNFNNAIYDKINRVRNAQEETRVYSTFIPCPSVKNGEIIYENIKG